MKICIRRFIQGNNEEISIISNGTYNLAKSNNHDFFFNEKHQLTRAALKLFVKWCMPQWKVKTRAGYHMLCSIRGATIIWISFFWTMVTQKSNFPILYLMIIGSPLLQGEVSANIGSSGHLFIPNNNVRCIPIKTPLQVFLVSI